LAVASLVAACSGGGASAAPSAEPTTAPTEAPPASAGAEPLAVGYLPKDVVNKYFDAAKTGIDKAATELGGAPVTQVGPQAADAAAQIPFITDLTTQGVDAIIISAAGPDAVVPALEEAQAAGIKIVGFDASPAVGAYDVFVNQVDFSGVGINLAEWACELAPDCTGQIAVLSAAATAENQNQWIALMEETLATDPQFANLELVETAYGDDDATISTTQAQALLQKYPDLKVIVAPTTVGILAAAQVVSGAGSDVKVTGLGFPNDMKPFVADGTSPVFGLWSVPDLGYLAYQVADKLVKGEITGTEGETFTVPGLNGDAPYTIGADGVVILGPAYRFDATNVNDFDF
jgi:rhamnose transport system substrate-binding protein